MNDEPRYTDVTSPRKDGGTNHQYGPEQQQENTPPGGENLKGAVADFQNGETPERVYDVPAAPHREVKATRNLLVIIVLCAVLVIAAIGLSIAAIGLSINNASEIEALKKENAMLRGLGMAQSCEMITNSSCSNLTSNFTSDFNDSSSVSALLLSRISDIEANITALSLQTTTNKADISALQNSFEITITKLEGNISSLSNLATDFQSDLSRLQVEQTTLSLKTGRLEANISTLYSILSSAVEELQGNISALKTEIDFLASSVAHLAGNMTMFHSELVVFAERLTHLNSTVTNSLPTSLLMEVLQINESLNALKLKTTNLERNFNGQLSVLGNEINNLENAQASSEQEIEENETSLVKNRKALIGVGVGVGAIATVALLCSCIACWKGKD